jgi:hypothetical protein
VYKPVGVGAGAVTAGGALAVTGANVIPWLIVAVTMIAVGLVLLRFTMVRKQARAVAGPTSGRSSASRAGGPDTGS